MVQVREGWGMLTEEEEKEDPLRKDVVRWCNRGNAMWRRWQILHCHCPHEHPFVWAKDCTFVLERYTCPFLSSKTFWTQKRTLRDFSKIIAFIWLMSPLVSMFSIRSGPCSCSCLESQGEGLEASLQACRSFQFPEAVLFTWTLVVRKKQSKTSWCRPFLFLNDYGNFYIYREYRR